MAETERIVLIVDDDQGLLRLVSRTLQREGLATHTAATGADALAWLQQNRPELMLLDLKLPDFEGMGLIQRLEEIGRRPPFIVITGQGDERVAVEMMKRGAMDYLVKDAEFLQFVPAVVLRAFEQLHNLRRLEAAEEQARLMSSAIEQGFNYVLIATAETPAPRVVYINPVFAQATGYAPEAVIGQPLSALTDFTSLQARLQESISKGEQFLELIAVYPGAEGERWGEWRVGPVRDKTGQISHWLIIVRDITERKRLEKEILQISERERQRIGQDLHDSLCQQLAGIELMSQALEHKLAPKSKEAAGRVAEIAAYVRNAIHQARSLARGLSPVSNEPEGLMTALLELAANTERMFGVNCEFLCRRPVLIADSVTSTHLYRIAQEAISNAIKHGHAQQIAISLEASQDRIILSISDDGAGFPPSLPNNPGMGLSIMKYRAGVLGGVISLEKNAKGGVVVICSAPVGSSKMETN